MIEAPRRVSGASLRALRAPLPAHDCFINRADSAAPTRLDGRIDALGAKVDVNHWL